MKLNVRSHTGKIGRLPYEIRCQLGCAIQEGVPGVRLVAWLNSLPQVQTILQRNFGGKPINGQNLSKWKTRGYPDWLQEQAFAQFTIGTLAKHIDRLPLSSNGQTSNQS